MDDWRFRTATEQGAAIASGELDPVDLTEAHLAAIAAHPDTPLVYARVTADRARAEAAAASQRAAGGSRLGPLDGVPISWKDLYDTAGVATEGGSRLLAGRVPDVDAIVLQRATAAGLICLGKTHTSELAFSGLGINPMAATAPNRHDRTLAPGGSSSGAAVSTALGLAAAGIGSDTGGSVRIPAAWNDLVGLKTTAGLLPLDGVLPLSPTYDTVGPLTRSVSDAALLFGVLGATPPIDLGGSDLEAERLHVVENVVAEDCDPTITAAVGDVIDRLAAAGAPVTSGAIAELDETSAAIDEYGIGVAAEGWRQWGGQIEANPGVVWSPIEQRFRTGIEADRGRSPEALVHFDRLAATIVDRIADHGLLVMPTTPGLPPTTQRVLDDADHFGEQNPRSLRNTRLANKLRLSAITVPTGVPMIGLMIWGPPHGEARLLRAAAAIERALA